jgi:hypothetical protein
VFVVFSLYPYSGLHDEAGAEAVEEGDIMGSTSNIISRHATSTQQQQQWLPFLIQSFLFVMMMFI